MLRNAMLPLCLLGLLFIGRNALGGELPASDAHQTANNAKEAAQQPDFNSIGNLSILLSSAPATATGNQSVIDKQVFEPGAVKSVYFSLNTDSTNLTATYRFPGDEGPTQVYPPRASEGGFATQLGGSNSQQVRGYITAISRSSGGVTATLDTVANFVEGMQVLVKDVNNKSYDGTFTITFVNRSANQLQWSAGIELPSNVNIFLLELKWCSETPNPCAGGIPEKSYPKFGCPQVTLRAPCTIDAVFVRELIDDNNNLVPAFILSKYYLEVSKELIKHSRDYTSYPTFPTLVINGYSVNEYFYNDNSQDYFSRNDSVAGGNESTFAVRSGWESVRDFSFERYKASESCRPYADERSAEVIDAHRPDFIPLNLGTDNGITLLAPKVFDVFALRQLLASTASQLAGISGFNSGSITGAFGNIQGVTSDTSYLSAQVTTVATPTVSSVVSNGNTGSNTIGNTSGQSSAVSGSNSTITCPPGTLPGVGTSGLPACVPLSATTTGAGNVNGGVSTQGGSTTNSGTNSGSSATNTLGTSQQNSTTTNSGGQAGTVAPVPVSNAPSAPTNIGVSAQDIFAEQVQLNSQITTLRMALQGALSDQYLVTQGKASGSRQQTTLGISVSLNPPRRYKHAVAEVRIWVYPTNGGQPVSIVNLLPAAKTYNVAKITSSQKAFGAGVAIDMVNVGVAGGKSKNRLYLAKDTDTVALQYLPNQHEGKPDDWPYGAVPVGRSVQDYLRDAAREVEIWQKLTDPCADGPGPPSTSVGDDSIQQANPVVFGWQFRPVLGADYVQSGLRQVFAQLALPASLGRLSSPKVYIQTRWREYNAKTQVVGAVYSGSCSFVQDTDPIQVVSPLKVHTVSVDDMGSGVLKISARGTFFSQGFSVMSGPNTVSPTTFDGLNIQFFANASNLLLTDDLKLVAEDGEITPLGVKPVRRFDKGCGISSATLHAVPRPDGNSWVEATITSGPSFDLERDNAPHPLFLIGTQVYGLHETPFIEKAKRECKARLWNSGIRCKYHFLASTDTLRSAETYTIRDLSWANFKKTGTIEFEPSFNGLATLASTSPAGSDDSSNSTTSGGGSAPSIYTLSGTDLLKLRSPSHWNCTGHECLEVFQGLSRLTLTDEIFQVPSRTTAVITLGPRTPSPVIGVMRGKATIGPAITTASKQAASVLLTSNRFPLVKGKGPAKPVKPTRQTVIFYTTNGSLPTTESLLYTVPIAIAAGATVKAIAISGNQLPSEIAVAKVIAGPKASLIAIPSLTTSQFNYKFYRFIWHPTLGDPIEWDLSVPQATTPAVTASAILNAGDSTQITFSGVDVLQNSAQTRMTFFFNDGLLPNALFSYDPTKKTLKFFITSDMTAKPGHKEIILNGYTKGPDGKPTVAQVLLPFDVTRR